MSKLSDDLAALKRQPATGYCINHAMPVTAGETCPNREVPEGGTESFRVYCGPGCTDWRDRRPSEMEPVQEPERSCETCKHRGFTCFDFDADDLKCGRGLPLWNVGGYDRAVAEAKEKLIAAVEEELGEREPESRIELHACLTCKHLTAEGADEPCASCSRNGGYNVENRWQPIPSQSEAKEPERHAVKS